MKKTIQFKHNSKATVVQFDSLEEVAMHSLPFLREKTVGLSGGSTFNKLFPLWVHRSPDCRHTSFFPVDERIVPFESQDSNWGTAYRLFFKPLGKLAERSHFASSATVYRDLLGRFFGSQDPVFDVIFLGVGSDGHTASLFPHQPYLSDYDSMVLQTKSPIAPQDRITLAPKVLVNARKLIVIVTGERKKNVVSGIFQKNTTLPIVRILSERSDSTLFIDRELMP